MLGRLYTSTSNSSDALLLGNVVNANVLTSWMGKNVTLPYCIVIFYIMSIFGIQRYMNSRKAFKLRGPLIAWNALLACYSLFTTCYVSLRYFPFLRYQGLSKFLCDNSATTLDANTTMVAFAFALSKIVELGDTYFIVLRKRELSLLHWYHHVTVLLLVWHAGMEGSSIGQYFGSVNTFIHSLMYTYFALKCMRIKISRIVSMLLTSLQILQMLSALAVSWFVYTQKKSGQPCHVSNGLLHFACIIYVSYAFLFMKFFIDAYVVVLKDRAAASKKE